MLPMFVWAVFLCLKQLSNHYFYTLQDLKEKMINLAYCEEKLNIEGRCK